MDSSSAKISAVVDLRGSQLTATNDCVKDSQAKVSVLNRTRCINVIIIILLHRMIPI